MMWRVIRAFNLQLPPLVLSSLDHLVNIEATDVISRSHLTARSGPDRVSNVNSSREIDTINTWLRSLDIEEFDPRIVTVDELRKCSPERLQLRLGEKI